MNRPILAAFDGPDGSGKSLAAHLLGETYLELDSPEKNAQVVRARMPGGTPLGTAIRTAFKDPAMKIDPLNERLMMAIDSRQFMLDVVQKAQAENKILLVDRWSPFTDYCYGLARGLDYSVSINMQQYVPQIQLDILFIVMAKLESIKERLKNDPERAKKPCRMESDPAYAERVYRFYQVAAGLDAPKTENERIVFDRARICAKKVIVLQNDNMTPRQTALMARKYINAIERGGPPEEAREAIESK